jgi:hypothetical protein
LLPHIFNKTNFNRSYFKNKLLMVWQIYQTGIWRQGTGRNRSTGLGPGKDQAVKKPINSDRKACFKSPDLDHKLWESKKFV